MNGFGILSYKCGAEYRGTFFQNRRQGNGIIYYKNGNKFVGFFDKGKR